MRRLDGATPVLTGSHAWAPSTGRVGDIDGQIAIVLNNEMTTLSVYSTGIFLHDIDRGTPFGGVRVKGVIASWLEFPGPRVMACDVVVGDPIPVQTVDAPCYTPVVFSASSGIWVVYQTDALGGVCHRIDNPAMGYRFGTPQQIFDPDVLLGPSGSARIGWSVDEGQFTQDRYIIPVLGRDMVPLTSTPPPPVPPTPGPTMTDTLTSENGTYRLLMQNDGNLVLYGPDGPLWASNTVQPAPVPPGPTPPQPPVGQDGRVGGSFYTALTCPYVEPRSYAQALANCGVGLTRVWLLDAWAVNAGDDAGQYPGFLPVTRTSDGRFDLHAWDTAYFDRLAAFTQALNDQRIVVQYSLLELYTWAQRKQGLLWVPDANLGPWRDNVNGVRWGDPDDPTFFALPDAWMDEFLGRVLEVLDGRMVRYECANEMPEKSLQYRLRDALRALGYAGPVQVNRQDDTPGQYWNMGVDRGDFQTLALHGKRDLSYLDEVYLDEAEAGRPTTFREMWPLVDASRITLSSDGCRKSTDVADAYDYPALTAVATDTLARGADYEHQLACKLRIFTDGRFRLEDIEEFDGPFLKGLPR
jgi:hypothetical protein